MRSDPFQVEFIADAFNHVVGNPLEVCAIPTLAIRLDPIASSIRNRNSRSMQPNSGGVLRFSRERSVVRSQRIDDL